MRKLFCGLLVIFCCGSFPSFDWVKPSNCVFAQDEATEDAQIFFDEALTLKRKGNVEDAAKMFLKSIRTSRSVLANDDHGMIDDLKKYCEKQLQKDDKNLKILDTLGFLYAVCYSDSENAIKNYQKVYDLADSEKVKEKTQRLIERIKATAEAEEKAQDEMSEQMRNEKLKSWSEMEKGERLGDQNARSKQLGTELAASYRSKDRLKNRIPQLKTELKNLKADYERQNRRWHTTNDQLYNRRRRRLREDIASKEKELSEAKDNLENAVVKIEVLEKEDQNRINSSKLSPIRSYSDDNDDSPPTTTAEQPSVNDPGSPPTTTAEQPSVNDPGSPPPSDEATSTNGSGDGEQGNVSNTEEQPLPVVDPEPETVPASNTSDTGKEANEDKLDNLINSL